MHCTQFKDLSGKVFGEWTVLGKTPHEGKRTRFFCRCSCGKESIVYSVNLTRGLSKSCNTCSRKRLDNYTGLSKSPTYSIYIQMIERCHNENNKYYRVYGGRGIKVCEHWLKSFKNFLSDMGEKPEGLSIDRIDNDKGYSKENCRWTDRKTQSRNRRNSIKIGEISKDWKVIDRSSEKKTYFIECQDCGFIRKVLSCNFRNSLRKHICEVNHAAQ